MRGLSGLSLLVFACATVAPTGELPVPVAAAVAAPAAAPGLELTPTIHCMGLRVRGVAEEIAAAGVRYRKQSEPAWREGLPLVVALGNRYAEKEHDDETAAAWTDAGPIIRRLHGSLFYLQPATSYDVEVTLRDAAGATKGTLSASARTLADQVAYGQGRTLEVGQGAQAAYKTIAAALKAARPGDTVVVAPGVYAEPVSLSAATSGRPGEPITLRGQKGAILDGRTVPASASSAPAAGGGGGGVRAGLFALGAHDVIIEGFLIRRYDYCMFLNGCRGLVVQRNYVDLTDSARGAHYGIRMKRCTDCLLQFNCVREPAPGQGHYTQYPFSVDLGRRNVIRYNQMLGGACQDIISTRANADTDIYENVFRGSPADDGVELEGGVCMNLRFFHNLLDCPGGAKATVSTTPVTVGPVYVVRNVFVCSREAIKFANDETENALKAGHRLCDFAPLLFYHNAWYGPKDGLFRILGYHGRPTLVNNIIGGQVMPDVTKNLRADRSTRLYARVESDFNCWFDGGRTPRSPTPSLDAHSLFADPLFVDAAGGNFHLSPTSPAIDKAQRLPNINDTFSGAGPDIGCFEAGSDWTGRTLREPLKDDPR